MVKYALSSTAKAYTWKRAIIKIELDSDFSSEKEKNDLEAFVREEFKGIELFFFNTRNKFQEDWIETYDLINDNFIYYQGNHDHIFFNTSNEYLKNIVYKVKHDVVFYHILFDDVLRVNLYPQITSLIYYLFLAHQTYLNVLFQ